MGGGGALPSAPPLPPDPERCARVAESDAGVTPAACQRFFAKELLAVGIPIRAPACVSDAAMYVARDRVARMLHGAHPSILERMRAAGCEINIIAEGQGCSALPEHAYKDAEEKERLDKRARGFGGRAVACGEENLLGFADRDRKYEGRDILSHELAHGVMLVGLDATAREAIHACYARNSIRWDGVYASTDSGEYFAEGAMWYVGTQGETGSPGSCPARSGPRALQQHDPELFALIDDILTGGVEVEACVGGTQGLLPLQPLPPGDAVPSAGTTTPCELVLRNMLSSPVEYAWIDFGEASVVYGVVPPGGEQVQPSLALHVWAVEGMRYRLPEDGRASLIEVGRR